MEQPPGAAWNGEHGRSKEGGRVRPSGLSVPPWDITQGVIEQSERPSGGSIEDPPSRAYARSSTPDRTTFN